MLENSNNSAAKKFKVGHKIIREWVQNTNKQLPIKVSRCRLNGREWKLTDVELEERELSWIHERCANIMVYVPRKLIIFKAKSIYDKTVETMRP